MPSSHQSARINEVLYAIHRDISGDLSARRLAAVAAFSEQHFHRVFQAVVGESLHRYVRRTRLEQAANQLMFDPQRPVIEIAEMCGFSSLSSFSQAFKNTFAAPPGAWRKIDRRSASPPFLEDAEIAAGYQKIQVRELPLPQLKERQPQALAYVRHQGYGRSIRLAWQTLQAWAAANQRPFQLQIGLHHTNPAWVALENCRYVAGLGIDAPVVRRGVVSSMVLPGGLHAEFELQGYYGELLPWLSRILEEWLPHSGFKMQTTPAFVHYRKNHFLAPDEQFDAVLCLPVSPY